MKLLYLSTWDFTNEESDGVCKKIYSQISVFEKEGYSTDLIYLKDNKIMYREDGQTRVIGNVGNIKKTPAYLKMYKYLNGKKYDWVYNRYGMMDTFYYRVLKVLKRNGARMLIEVPTYPYVGEKTGGLLYWLMFKWDELYLKKLKAVADRIVTYSQDEEIWSIPTIRVMNGVDLEFISPVSGERRQDDKINLLIVALMQPYHGYERLLYGLKQYYENGGKRKIICHLVGEGPEKAAYEKIAKENGLKKNVIFYGKKGGNELTEIYNRVDLGICSLGCYKKGIYWSSELKSREYLARGIPFITGIKLDISDVIDQEVFIEFPNDESILDIERIVDFYDSVYKRGRKEVIVRLRRIAEQWISIEATMKPVCDYFKGVF